MSDMNGGQLTEEEADRFEYLLRAADAGQLVMARTVVGGEDRAAVCSIESDGDGYILRPVALLLLDEHFDALMPPSNDVEVVTTR